jgi:hypothetical protein
MGRWRHSMIGPDLARSRRLRQRRKLGWYRITTATTALCLVQEGNSLGNFAVMN